MQTCIMVATYMSAPNPMPEGTVIATFVGRESRRGEV
jgi:hypothetical protein